MAIEAYNGRFSAKSLMFNSEVHKKGDIDLVAEGHITLACVSQSTFQSMPVPDEIRERLKPYAVE